MLRYFYIPLYLTFKIKMTAETLTTYLIKIEKLLINFRQISSMGLNKNKQNLNKQQQNFKLLFFSNISWK